MSNNFLFSIINQAKDLGCYEIANRAFAVLLCHALRGDDLNLYIDSDVEDCDESLDDYYGLLSIVQRGNERSACIPLPLIKTEVLTRLRDEGWLSYRYRGEHNREPLTLPEAIRKQMLNTLDWALWRAYPRCHDEATNLLNLQPSVPQGWEIKGYVSLFDHTEALWRALRKPTYWEFRRESLLPQESWGFNDRTLWEILPLIPQLILEGYTVLWDVE